MLKRLLGETVALEFQPPSELPPVNADDGMLEQVIMNLSVNARDAMLQGGTLTISLNPVSLDSDYVQNRPEARVGEFVCLRVTDTGSGMEAATMARIFEPFFTTKEVGKGTGLGLATVYGIVKQHGGWIEVASEVGDGTAFSVFLPACAPSAGTGKEKSDTTAFFRGGDETILVVEDESVLRELAHAILEGAGYQIVEAASGREALDVWRQYNGKIDLVLTDMVMPEGISGVDLAKRLIAVRPDVKIIFASGYTVDDVSTDFLARSNNARFLQKPYTHDVLIQTVRQALDGKSVQAPPDAAPAQ